MNSEPGSYHRLTMATDSCDWLPAGLVDREAVPEAVTRKAAKYLASLPRGAHDVVAIQAGRGAGLTIEQLSAWAEPQTVARALAFGSRPWRDLWILEVDTPASQTKASTCTPSRLETGRKAQEAAFAKHLHQRQRQRQRQQKGILAATNSRDDGLVVDREHSHDVGAWAD